MTCRRLVMLTACLLVVACGPGPEGRERQGAPSAPVNTKTPQAQLSPQQMQPRPGMTDVEPVAWDHAHAGEDGRSIHVTWQSGPPPCFVLDHVELTQSAEVVTVTLFEGRDPQRPKRAVCPAILVKKTTTVMLDAPLGGREIVDGVSKPGS
jgi:hypothetical protein